MKFRIAVCVFFTCCLLAAWGLACSACASQPSVDADAAYLLHVNGGEVLYEKNAGGVIYPASTVKIMTGYLACQALGARLEESVTLTKSMLGPGSGYRCLNLKAGQTVTVRDLLYGAVCGCDYDACYAVASLVSGNSDTFVQAMNDAALSLGAVSTHYTNPTGVHNAAMVTTTADTARIALAAYGNDLYLQIASASEYTCSNGTLIRNRNALVSPYPTSTFYDSRYRGLNTGNTDEGGYCLVTAATDAGETYLAVVMHDTVENRQYRDAVRLMDWAFSNFGRVTLVTAGEQIGSLPVTSAEHTESVSILASKTVTGFYALDMTSSDEYEVRWIPTSDTLEAPFEEGTQVGILSVSYQGERIATVPAVTAEGCEKSGFQNTLDWIRSITEKRSVRAGAVIALVLFTAYFTVVGILYRRRQKRRRNFR